MAEAGEFAVDAAVTPVGAHNSVVGADQGFRAPSWSRNRYEIRYARTQHRPSSRQVNDHGRVSGTHRVESNQYTLPEDLRSKYPAEPDKEQRRELTKKQRKELRNQQCRVSSFVAQSAV